MLSIDPYLNETTRHAHVILPPPPPSQSAHFDFALNNLAVRNNARYSPPALPLDGRPDEPEILSRLALILYGVGYDADPALVDDQVIATTLEKETADPNSPVAGRAVDELTAMLIAGPGYERRLDMMLRLGPYGDAFGANPDGLTLERLKAAPHGIDFGPLQPRVPEVLRTRSGRIELAPDALIADVARLQESLGRGDDGFVLIGRRHLRSNNSWMHNLPALAGGTNRCTLQIHPDDAAELGLDGQRRDQGSRRRRWWRRSNWRRGCGAASFRCLTGGVTTAAAHAKASQPTNPASTSTSSTTAASSTLCRALPSSTGFRSTSRPRAKISSKMTVTEKLTVCWPGSSGTAAASAPLKLGTGVGGVGPA